MKTILISILTSIIYLITQPIIGQSINWSSCDQSKHVININMGLQYGINYGISYGYRQQVYKFPTMITLDVSMPAGEKKWDDYKIRLGGQIRWIKAGDFQLSTRLQGVFRRYQNDFTRLVNFGSDMAASVGYYRPHWFVGTEIGFDKAIVTHFKHSSIYKSQYAEVLDGWYEPATGGNFYYGLQSGYTFGRSDIYLKAGKVLTQNFKTTPLLPLYMEMGFNRKF